MRTRYDVYSINTVSSQFIQLLDLKGSNFWSPKDTVGKLYLLSRFKTFTMQMNLFR